MKDKCKQFAMKIIESSLDDHYATTQQDGGKNIQKERVKSVFSSFPELNQHPNAMVINEFIGHLMSQISAAVYELNKQRTLLLISNGLDSLVDELLTEEESGELFAFISTDVGQKVFRNLDLVRECIMTGRNILSAEIITAWNDPSVAIMIGEYIKSLDES